MWTKGIKRVIEKNRNELLGLIFRRYPRFVLDDRVHNLADIPAFVFHDVTAESLEPMLQFLAENGYATLTANEYAERQARRERGQEREVLLTFDDGHESLFSVAYPALKRFDFKAVAYIVPGMVPEGNGSGTGGTRQANLCNWQQIGEMHESGVVDFQSHSMYHHSISASDRIVDFVRPGMSLSFLDSHLVPVIQELASVRASVDLAYGTPIHDWVSRFTEAPAFRESPSVVRACVDYVKCHGGSEYFGQRDWRRRLKSVVADTRRKDSGASYETKEEQRDAILMDFIDSKREIERRLRGTTVRHFCFPWFRGSVLAGTISTEAGYVSNAWGSVVPKFATGEKTPIAIARFLPPYLWRLPGKGRKSLAEVLRIRLYQVCKRSLAIL